jgi:phosphoribosylamine--glycine ligase
VGIVMGSDSDLPVMAECVRVLSAHRSPEAAARFARSAESRGIEVLVAGAGGAAHLAGAMAAHSTLPVIGVPLAGSPLSGFDSLLSTVQMPPGVPVATVGVGPMGAKNAGHLAAQILAVKDAKLRRAVKDKRAAMAAEVLAKADGLPRRLRELLKG